MTAGSRNALDAGPQPWPTGRRKKPVSPELPARPIVVRSYRRPVPPVDPTAPRPRVVDDTSLLGFSRLTRSRTGARIYRLFVVFVFGLILVQLIATLLHP